MGVKIGHASLDENRRISGGRSGDSTKKEVFIRDWYSKPWQYCLRCKDSTKAEKMAIACEKGCNNDKIGYDQNQRNSLYTQAKANNFDLSKIKTPCETDCSAFMTCCAIAGGVDKLNYINNAPTTSTMKDAFFKTGEFEVLTDSKYLTSDKHLKRGDILVKAGSHTVMVLENGNNKNPYSEPSFIVQYGTTGTNAKWVQFMLNAVGYNCSCDGKFYTESVAKLKKFQKDNNLAVDGKCGKASRDKLNSLYAKLY